MSIDEVRNRFVTHTDFVSSTTRSDIWDAWNVATEALRRIVPVGMVWLGGSFTTSKLNPHDIDCTYWIDADEVEFVQSDAAKAAALSFFAQGRSLKSQGLPIDNFLLTWRGVPDPSLASTEDSDYYLARGHWDDWWQRERVSALGSPPSRQDAVSRRGYVEVIIDGF